MTNRERYTVLLNIIARTGIDGDVIAELAKAESMINMIEQQKMIPPPVPSDVADMGAVQNTASQTAGKYDDL